MPVRSFNSRVMRWPDRETVDRAARAWAVSVAAQVPAVIAIGYFGSYARGDYGVGSDLDLVVILQDSDAPRYQRTLGWQTERLPVPCDVLTYTLDEWRALASSGYRIYQALTTETVWVWGAPPGTEGSRR